MISARWLLPTHWIHRLVYDAELIAADLHHEAWPVCTHLERKYHRRVERGVEFNKPFRQPRAGVGDV